LRRRRFAAGALNLDTAECEIRIGPDGRIADVISVPDDDSHHLVEECMVVANEAVADELRSASVRYISRRHDPPSPLKIEALEEELSELGLRPGDLRDRRRIASLLKETQDHPLARHIRFAVLRSMSRAVYSVESDGHFGLAKKCYAHFTSPIRRYPDLTLHRALARHLASRDAGSRPVGRVVNGKSGATDDDPLAATANHCTKTEYMSEMAERMVDEIMKLRFLAQSAASDSPRSFDAVVVRATPFGVFVELPDLQIQGLVHVSALSGDHAGFNRKNRSLSVGGKVYRLGTSLKVRPAAVDTESRRVDFRLEEGPACTPPPRRPGKKTGGMRGPKGARKRIRGRGQVRA